MSTVKIKTESTTAAAATVDVQVKLEPSLSTADIKLEQHNSDIDTKVEPDSEDDSDIKSEGDDEDTDQNQTTVAPKNQRRFICEYVGCGRSFSSAGNLKRHQYEHRLHVELNILGKTYIMTRQSLDDRWSCPTPDCKAACNTVNAIYTHMRRDLINTMRLQPQQATAEQKTQSNLHFFGVDNFYVNEVRCGYHTTIGVFICHECKLVPECLLTHLQQKHGYDEKSVDNSVLPESAVNSTADPSTNQHTSNSYLASAIRQPHWQHHQDIVQGWLCITSDCGYYGFTTHSRNDHKRIKHQGEQLTTVPALVLRLTYAKSHANYFLITRIDQVTTSNNRANQHKLDYSNNGLNIRDENGDDIDQSETTESSNQKQQWKCEYPDCRRYFNSSDQLNKHRREHKLEVVINVRDKTFALSRQSTDDRWACPFPDCKAAYNTISGTRVHIQNTHSTLTTQKRIKSEVDDDQQQQQQQQKNMKRRPCFFRYLKVDGFYVTDVCCGYHNATGLFICYKCKLVPECLLIHLQQKHGYDEISIDNAKLPESARTAGSDPNINQHISNTHLALAISQPYQWHQDIVQGWLCIAPNCGYCYSTKESRNQHQYKEHRGEQQSTVPALVLRLLYGKVQTSCFLITRLDTTTDKSDIPTNSPSQYKSECDDDDDGDELVLSDYSDEDDIH